MDKIYDVLIIGSGPAGLTAGIYAVRAGLSTLIFSGANPGGQLTQTTLVENFPGFPEGVMGPVLMENTRKQAVKLGVEDVIGIVNKVDFSPPSSGGTGLRKGKSFKVWIGESLYEGRSVIIATGTETKWLGIPSEKKLIGRGVSSCATCDGFFFKDKEVVVVGGGDTALEEALYLTKFASEVTVIHRRDTLRACELLQKKAKANPKIKFIWNSEVAEIVGEEKVIGVKIKDVGRMENLKEIKTDGVFMAIGHTPQTEIFAGKVERDEKGYIMIDQRSKIPPRLGEAGKDPACNCLRQQPMAGRQKLDQKLKIGERYNNDFKMMTSVPGVFAAGDVHDSVYKQAITAAGYGCMAALEVDRWLEENG